MMWKFRLKFDMMGTDVGNEVISDMEGGESPTLIQEDIRYEIRLRKRTGRDL